MSVFVVFIGCIYVRDTLFIPVSGIIWLPFFINTLLPLSVQLLPMFAPPPRHFSILIPISSSADVAAKFPKACLNLSEVR